MESYAVFDCNTGEYTRVTTQEEALQLFWSRVVEVARTHFHGTAYVTIQQNDNGTETWINDAGHEIDRPRTAEEIAELIKRRPPVEILP
jgi:hypothetical protein